MKPYTRMSFKPTDKDTAEEPIPSIEDMKSDDTSETMEESNHDEGADYKTMIDNCSTPEQLTEIISYAQSKLDEMTEDNETDVTDVDAETEEELE